MNKKTTAIVASEGWICVAASVAILAFLLIVGCFKLATLAFFWTLFTLFFYRNLERVPEEMDSLVVVAPVDGKVVDISNSNSAIVIRVENGIFDSHILRSPAQATIKEIAIRGGIFGKFGSSLDELVESETIHYETTNQAKEILLNLKPMIRSSKLYRRVTKPFLGQRVGFFHGGVATISLPLDTNIRLAVGDKIIAGESAIAFLKASDETVK